AVHRLAVAIKHPAGQLDGRLELTAPRPLFTAGQVRVLGLQGIHPKQQQPAPEEKAVSLAHAPVYSKNRARCRIDCRWKALSLMRKHFFCRPWTRFGHSREPLWNVASMRLKTRTEARA